MTCHALCSPIHGHRRNGDLHPVGVMPFAVVLWLSMSTDVPAQGNFVARDAAIIAVAEEARRESALFWTGVELPGRWSTPCSIEVQPAQHSGGGTTRFHFDRGEVSGWQMIVTGRRPELLHDVVPHEVDHMVRASLIRRPLPRWLDEGCAMLFESPESHRRYRERVVQFLDEPIDTSFLDRFEYPTDSRAIDRLYVVGFSLVEFLIERRGSGHLFAFQQDARLPSQKLQDFYDLTPESLTVSWREWVASQGRQSMECHHVNCPRHARPTQNVWPSPPVLTVYTSSTCGPCRQFYRDLETDPQFREALRQRFHLRVIDIDRQQTVAMTRQITSVPTFETSQGRLIGYQGKTWLLQQLGIPVSKDSPTTSPENTSSPQRPAERPQEQPPESPLKPPQPAPSQPAASTERTPAVPIDGSTEHRNNQRARPAVKAVTSAVLTSLQLAALVSGSAATGGLGTLALTIALRRLRRRTRDPTNRSIPPSSHADAIEKVRSADGHAPFPRALDETRELLQLRESEGRVAALDTLRGMVLDDELDRLAYMGDPTATQFVQQLREALTARLNDVAPVVTKVGS